ncbi:MAG: GNAT family N-acetyltransferase [Hyphomicrobium sp.]
MTGRRAGRLVLVWPLLSVRAAGARKLASLGCPVSQYSDALIEASTEASKQLRGAWDSVVAAVKPDLAWLPRVREDAAIAPLMHELGALAAQRMEAPYIDLSCTPDFDAYMLRRSAQARKKHRAAERRLAKMDARFVELAASESASALAAASIDMKQRQLAERGLVSPAFSDPSLRKFFADAARGGAHRRERRSSGSKSTERAPPRTSCSAAATAWWVTSLPYDSRFAKDSVGAHVLHHTIKQAIAGGYQTFDLLSPADEYKMRCADGTVGVVSWAVPLSAKGTAFARIYLMLARPLLKAAVELLPARLRSALARAYYGRIRAQSR